MMIVYLSLLGLLLSMILAYEIVKKCNIKTE